MSSDVTLYFDVTGMTCNACVSTIENRLISEKIIKEAGVSFVTNRVRVVVDKSVNPETIANMIEEVGYTAKWIDPKSEETLHFSLAGLNLPKDAKVIEEYLNQKNAYVKSCVVEYATKNATITTCINEDQAKKDNIIKQLKTDISEAIKDKKITATLITPNLTLETNTHEQPSLYFHRAKINVYVGLPLFLLGLAGFIPLPITMMGMMVGSAIGGSIFWVMRETGGEFYRNAWDEFIKRRSFNMNTLIALGTGSAWLYSMILVLTPLIFPTLFPIAALQYQFLAVNMILGIINFGKGIKAYAQEQTRKQIQKLSQVYVNLQPQIVKRLKLKNAKDLFVRKDLESHFEQVKYTDIHEGDIIQVNAGERVPVEGIIMNDVETFVNQDTLTGESTPCFKTKGDEVYSGSMNNKNKIYIRASRHGADGQLTRVIEHVAKSSATKPSISRLVDKLATIFVPTIIALSLISALGWYIFGPVYALPFMVKSAMSVLLCACPCALGLATPISTALSMYKLFNKGILVVNANALEAAANIDTVVFDKTGTLTKPVIDLNDENGVFTTYKKLSKLKILQLVASLEQATVKKGHDHPIARSFINSNISMELLNCTEAKKDDQGVSGIVAGVNVLAGSLSHLQANNVKVSSKYKEQANKNERDGKTSVYIALKKRCVAVVALKHDIVEDASKAIKDLKDLGIQIYMLTGDKKGPSEAIAKKLGIHKIHCEKDSNMKKQIILDLNKNKKCSTAMVGDGINDFEAITGADLGIAVSWTAASSAAQVSLQKLNIAPLIVIAKETMKNIRQNLWWTAIYNLFSIIAAMGLLYPLFGITINPIIASVAMAISSIIVVINSKRLGHQIDHKFDIYEGKIAEPKTFFEKMKHLFSPTTIYKTISELMSDYGEEQAESENAVPTQIGGAAQNTVLPMNNADNKKNANFPAFNVQKNNTKTNTTDDEVFIYGVKGPRLTAASAA